MSDIKELLAPLLRVLKDLGGQFVFSDEDGDRFVITRLEELEGVQERQGTLDLGGSYAEESLEDSEDDITDLVNQDIALSREIAEVADDLGIRDDYPRPSFGAAQGGSAQVRFEPLKGDISPDLQE